jgi:hypothetical protein
VPVAVGACVGKRLRRRVDVGFPGRAARTAAGATGHAGSFGGVARFRVRRAARCLVRGNLIKHGRAIDRVVSARVTLDVSAETPVGARGARRARTRGRSSRATASQPDRGKLCLLRCSRVRIERRNDMESTLLDVAGRPRSPVTMARCGRGRCGIRSLPRLKGRLRGLDQPVARPGVSPPKADRTPRCPQGCCSYAACGPGCRIARAGFVYPVALAFARANSSSVRTP